MFKNFCILIALCCFSLIVRAQSGTLEKVKSDASNFEAVNKHILFSTTDGKNIVHLDTAGDAGIAWLKHTNFSTGIIEFDVKQKDVLQHSFVGIAFHGTTV